MDIGDKRHFSIDSSVSEYAVKDLRIFKRIQKTKLVELQVDKGSILHASHKGIIKVWFEFVDLMMDNLYYLPLFNLNSRSWGSLEDQSITTTFRKNKCYFIGRWKMNKLSGKMDKDREDGLFKARIKMEKQRVCINVSRASKPVGLWDERMGHV